MPEPMTMAAMAATAFQNPQIQNAALGLGRGLGRGLNYGLQGAGSLMGQAGTGIADMLGALGQQYLPKNVNWAGGKVRDLNRYLSQGAAGLYNTVAGNEPQGQMPMQPQAMQGQMGMMGGMQGMQGQMNPMAALQQNYMQRIQQPYQHDYGAEEQQLMNRYNQEIVPGLARQFGGADAMNSSGYRNASLRAGGNLLTDLRALGNQGRREENMLNAQQLRDQGQFALGQGQLGLGQRRLRQEGNIAQQQEALRQMGLMGGYGQQQHANYMDQLIQQLNTQGNLANLGMNQPYQQVQQAGQPGFNWAQAGGQALNALGRGAAAYGTGGWSEVAKAFNQ